MYRWSDKMMMICQCLINRKEKRTATFSLFPAADSGFYPALLHVTFLERNAELPAISSKHDSHLLIVEMDDDDGTHTRLKQVLK